MSGSLVIISALYPIHKSVVNVLQLVHMFMLLKLYYIYLLRRERQFGVAIVALFVVTEDWPFTIGFCVSPR